MPSESLNANYPSLSAYTPGDRDAVIRLIAERFRDVGMTLDLEGDDRDLGDIPQYWQDAGGEFMLLKLKGELLGTLAARRVKEHPYTAEFDWFYLSPSAEGKGLSPYLMHWGLSWCLTHGIKTVELWTGEGRKGAHSIYRKIGFAHNGVKRQVRDNPPYHLLFYKLEINDESAARLHKFFERLTNR